VFLFWNALGGIAWAISVGLAAYILGPTAEHLFKVVGLVGIGIAVVIVAGLLILRRRRSDREPGSAGTGSSGRT
jgi:membrane protein DedA with SNARE-associated domain